MDSSTSFDPFQVLGVPEDASEAEIRARYLELVKQFPPERDPDKFRKVQAAFEAAKDPLVIAKRLLVVPSDEAPPWSDALEQQKRIPPRLKPTLLLSLGNRDDAYHSVEEGAEPSEQGQDPEIGGDPHRKRHFVERPHE